MADMHSRVAPGIALVRNHPAARALALTTLFAALTGLTAHVAIRLPFTPVPITFQVFGVLLAGAVLGSRLGALSQIQYLALGAAGLPVFAGGATGLTAFASPSAGYLPGFIAAAWLVGRLTERAERPTALRLFPALLAGVAALYLPGVLWLNAWLHLSGGSGLSYAALLGIAPFVGVDVVKAAAAAVIAARLRRAR